MIRIGTFNANNLFSRAEAMDLQAGFSEKGDRVLKDVQELDELLAQDSYAGASGARITELLVKYKVYDQKPPWFTINEIKKKLYSRKQSGGGITLKAKGRKDWIGCIELRRGVFKEEAIRNTGRVIQAVNADVLCLVEVENRPLLERFNEEILKPSGCAYPHNLLIDGNDDRGIDLGLYSRLEIRSVRSHIDDTYRTEQNKEEKVFSRDCPEYRVADPGGRYELWMLCNHLKSQGYGAKESNDAKRLRQAERAKDILSRFDLSKDYVVVAGDFNDVPGSAPIDPLLKLRGLHDVLEPLRQTGQNWTYRDGRAQFDYLLVSQALHSRQAKFGVERRGIYSRDKFKNKPGGPIRPFPEVTSLDTQASDHAAVWADFNL